MLLYKINSNVKIKWELSVTKIKNKINNSFVEISIELIAKNITKNKTQIEFSHICVKEKYLCGWCACVNIIKNAKWQKALLISNCVGALYAFPAIIFAAFAISIYLYVFFWFLFSGIFLFVSFVATHSKTTVHKANRKMCRNSFAIATWMRNTEQNPCESWTKKRNSDKTNLTAKTKQIWARKRK